MPKTKLNAKRTILTIMNIIGVASKFSRVTIKISMIKLMSTHINITTKSSLISSHSFLKYAISEPIPNAKREIPILQKVTGSLYGHCIIVQANISVSTK